MAGAWLSLFRVTGRHEAAVLWLGDLLEGDRRLWLVNEALEASAPERAILGMRLFDAGPFHAGFGIIVGPDEETLLLSAQPFYRVAVDCTNGGGPPAASLLSPKSVIISKDELKRSAARLIAMEMRLSSRRKTGRGTFLQPARSGARILATGEEPSDEHQEFVVMGDGDH